MIFPSFIDPSVASQIGDPEAGMLEPIFTIPLSPMVDVTAAIVFSFTMGLGISALRNNDKGEILYNLFQEFQEIITKVLSIIIIPLLPIYIAGTFCKYNICRTSVEYIKYILEGIFSSNTITYSIFNNTIYQRQDL